MGEINLPFVIAGSQSPVRGCCPVVQTDLTWRPAFQYAAIAASVARIHRGAGRGPSASRHRIRPSASLLVQPDVECFDALRDAIAETASGAVRFMTDARRPIEALFPLLDVWHPEKAEHKAWSSCLRTQVPLIGSFTLCIRGQEHGPCPAWWCAPRCSSGSLLPARQGARQRSHRTIAAIGSRCSRRFARCSAV